MERTMGPLKAWWCYVCKTAASRARDGAERCIRNKVLDIVPTLAEEKDCLKSESLLSSTCLERINLPALM